MNIFAIFNGLFLWACGFFLLKHIIKRWNDENKQNHKVNEVFQVVLFFIIGIYIIYLTDDTVDKSLQNKYNGIIFLIYSLLSVIFLGLNIYPNILRIKKDPKYREKETYEKFLDNLSSRYGSKEEAIKNDKIKDFTRKTLHFLQFALFIFLYEYTHNVDTRIKYGLSPDQFRNFILFLIGGFFWIMMMIGDLYRMENWRCLPKWGQDWFQKSLEPKREAWTLNSATSILLANFIFLHPIFPIQILFSATFTACVGDAMASIIGKNFGKHKLLNIGKHPNKSWEGLIAGALTSSIGVFIIFTHYPITNLPINYNLLAIKLLISLIVFIVFILIDLYIKNIADNITNPIIIGFILYFILVLVN